MCTFLFFVHYEFKLDWLLQISAYLHLRSRRISSFDTCFCWARKPTWLSKLECWSNILCSWDSNLWPSAVRILICYSWCVCFRSVESISLTSISRHLKLLESMASSTSFALNLLFCYCCIHWSNYATFEVSNSLLFEPRSFLPGSFIIGWWSSFTIGQWESSFLLLGEIAEDPGLLWETLCVMKIFLGTIGILNFWATLHERSSQLLELFSRLLIWTSD